MSRYTPPGRAKMQAAVQEKKPLTAGQEYIKNMPAEERAANLAKAQAKQREMRAQGISFGRPSKKEARREALREMEPRALQVLRERMESLDERISMQAAMRVLEYTQGKPQMEVRPKEEEQQVVYESAVMNMLTEQN